MTEPKANRLARLIEKKKQIENMIKQLEQKDKEKERRARVTRLIQIGALSEKYFNCPDIAPEDYEKLLKRFLETLKKPANEMKD